MPNIIKYEEKIFRHNYKINIFIENLRRLSKKNKKGKYLLNIDNFWYNMNLLGEYFQNLMIKRF
jgi:hypothetical protein